MIRYSLVGLVATIGLTACGSSAKPDKMPAPSTTVDAMKPAPSTTVDAMMPAPSTTVDAMMPAPSTTVDAMMPATTKKP